MRLFLTTTLTCATLLATASCDKFAKDSLGTQFTCKQREIASDDLFNEGKIADIYYVRSPSNRNIAVIKEFDKNEGSKADFQRELSAYNMLEKPRNHFFNSPTLLKSGEDDDHYYLMLTLASGENLYHWLRNGPRDQFLDGVEHSAKALRQFHSRLVERPLKENMARKKSRAQLYDSFNEVDKKKRFLNTEFTLGQVHGDLHPGNIFYDPESNEVTFIDFSTLTNPVKTMRGDPIAADAMKYLTSLQAVAHVYGYNQDEIDEIEAAFFKGYGTDLLSEEEIQVFKNYYALDLIDLINESNETDPLRKKQFAKLHEFAVTYV